MINKDTRYSIKALTYIVRDPEKASVIELVGKINAPKP